MKKQSGFAIVELIIILVILAGITGVGYVVWHRQHQARTTAAVATTTPVAPQINSSSDLNSALQALNQTSVSSSNTDSSQLSSRAAGF